MSRAGTGRVDIERFRVDRPQHFQLSTYDPCDTCGYDIEKKPATQIIARDIARLSKLQERLYSDGRWAVLLILQGMDASGKDSVIKHVMSGINPQGCTVHSFQRPTQDELDHDFMWRTTSRLPERGRIGIFNRSYYEEVVAVRVHRELLAHQKLPSQRVSSRIWEERFSDIRAFEHYLGHNGIVVVKFFLHISRAEQRQRLLARLDDPAKQWKFSQGDIADRRLWPRFMAAYEGMIRNTSTPDSSWYVVPADNKWFTRLVVARVLVQTLDKLDLKFPQVDSAGLRKLRQARRALLGEV